MFSGDSVRGNAYSELQCILFFWDLGFVFLLVLVFVVHF